jgi:hypothetical protein
VALSYRFLKRWHPANVLKNVGTQLSFFIFPYWSASHIKCWQVKYITAVSVVVHSALRVRKPIFRANKNAIYKNIQSIIPLKNGRSRPDRYSISEKLLQMIICNKNATYSFIIHPSHLLYHNNMNWQKKILFIIGQEDKKGYPWQDTLFY